MRNTIINLQDFYIFKIHKPLILAAGKDTTQELWSGKMLPRYTSKAIYPDTI